MAELLAELAREVTVTRDVTARVGDILAAQAYIDLRKWDRSRAKQP